MNCRRCQELLDRYLIARPGEADRAELARHVAECPRCSREHALAEQALASVKTAYKFRASPELKERIMNAVAEIDVAGPKPAAAGVPWVKVGKGFLAVGVAAALLIAAVVLLRPGPGGGAAALSASDLFVKAAAAEEALFSGSEIVHLFNAIEVKPVSDPRWAQARWFPIMSLEASGKPRFHQLTLSAEVGKGYTVEDHAWYDPATARFIRVLTADGTPIYANSFDGEAVYSLEGSSDNARRVVKHVVTKDFQPPKSPAELLGIAAGLPSRLSEEDKTPALDVVKAREVTLDDGSPACVLKLGYSRGGPKEMPDAHYLVTIRNDNHTIARMEFVAGKESLFVVRRVKTETVKAPAVAWNLAGIEDRLTGAEEKPPAGILADMVIPQVSVEHMIAKASFETYLFSPDPPWAARREIIDILDIPSPPHRAFAIAYRADDGRHVVLWQAQSNKMLAQKMTTLGKVIYTSSSGTKLWSIPMDKWLAGILLQSARATIKDPPAESRTGYLLETPAGTFPTLAINGQLTDEELHGLIDSLVPAKQ